ncbi:uvrABC system protein A [Trichonephila clavipes]|nr:uvrABC system protein A [Trichonephila clavipes]
MGMQITLYGSSKRALSTNDEARRRWSYGVGMHSGQRCWQECSTKLGLGSSFRFQHDNDPKYTVDIVKLWLLYNVPNQLHTPPQSPNLNPIEYLWYLLELRVKLQERKGIPYSRQYLNAVILVLYSLRQAEEGISTDLPRREFFFCLSVRHLEKVIFPTVLVFSVQFLIWLINTTNEWRLFKGHGDTRETTRLRVKGDIEDVSIELDNGGLNYLTLDRESSTLSGGESQRIRLASQIGSGLTGVLCVLDEPSIGLYQRDIDRFIATLKDLRDMGDTVTAVEHDEDTIMAADYAIDIGPGAGVNGGKLLQKEHQTRCKEIQGA